MDVLNGRGISKARFLRHLLAQSWFDDAILQHCMPVLSDKQLRVWTKRLKLYIEVRVRYIIYLWTTEQ